MIVPTTPQAVRRSSPCWMCDELRFRMVYCADPENAPHIYWTCSDCDVMWLAAGDRAEEGVLRLESR